METLDPFDVRSFIERTSWEAVEETAEYKLAYKLAHQVKALQPYVGERRYLDSWFDQLSRSSSSVLLNICEGMGRARGHWLNSFLVARGESYEVAGCLAIGPEEVCAPIRPLALEVIKTLNARLLATPLDRTER